MRAVNRKTALLAILLSVFLLSVMTVPALAQYDWDVGIEVGDTFKYKATLHLWEGNASFPAGHEYLQTYNDSDWQEYEVTDIEALIVTFEVTTLWKNGTETMDTLEEDMTSSMNIRVIGANLTEGTEIRPETTFLGSTLAPKYLNASIMREYESGPKETNVLIYNWTVLGNTYHDKLFWDKETGILVYFQVSTTDAHDMSGNWYSYNLTRELIETNVEGWIIPEFHAWTFMLLMVTATTIPLVLYKRRRLITKT